MNVLFLTTGNVIDLHSHGIYPDLLRTFSNHDHHVYIVSPYEKRTGLKTELKTNWVLPCCTSPWGTLPNAALLKKGSPHCR